MTGIQSIAVGGGGYVRTQRHLNVAPTLERARGAARLTFVGINGKTRLAECFQSGSAKILLPRTAEKTAKEAVLLNTAGGLTGGDVITYSVRAGSGSRAVVSTQAAERIYRRVAGSARVETTISVGAGAHLEWLPQETILFDRSALSRELIADVASDGTFLAVESFVLGRAAMGEIAPHVAVNDGWRIRRDGKLIYADGFRLDGNAEAVMARGATGGGALALATVVLLSPDAEGCLEAARAELEHGRGESGASAWNGMLVARLAAPGGQALKNDLIALIERLRGRAMPRVWYC